MSDGTGFFLRAGVALTQGVGGFPFPPALGFNVSGCGLSIVKQNGVWTATYDITKLLPPALLVATQYYVDIATGNDGNNGLSAAHPFQSIFRALNIGNAAAAPYWVNVKAGIYERAFSISGAGGTIVPTQDIYLVATNGRVVVGNWSSLTYALDGTFTNCYTASRSGVGRVVDLGSIDAFGDYTDLAQVPDAATCNTTPGSWALVGSVLYVHRADGAAVTNANTRAYLNGSAANFGCGTVNVYAEGFDFEGGQTSAVSAIAVATRNVILKNCTAKYAASAAVPGNGVSFDNMTGFAVCDGVTANANVSDGINAHWSLGGTAGLQLLAINCKGSDNGRFTSISNNGLTWHDGIAGIDVNGDYESDYGGNVDIINASTGLMVGTTSKNSHGDIPLGGGIPSTSFMTGNSAQMWLLEVVASGSTNALLAQGTSTIYKRNCTLSGAQTTNSSGVITTW